MKELNPGLAFCIGPGFKKKENGVSLIFLRDTFNLEILLPVTLNQEKGNTKME